jgi:hypothetical protein
MPEQPGGRNVQDLDSQPAAVETKHPATERIEDREADILS